MREQSEIRVAFKNITVFLLFSGCLKTFCPCGFYCNDDLGFRQPENCSLLIAHYSLLTTHCSLLIAHCKLHSLPLNRSRRFA
ncbi:MAG: hypothetical protein IJV35_08855 [Neisseriaceae bacterium]|nr:hypothetical protein [Neisseriaceae bacterium]